MRRIDKFLAKLSRGERIKVLAIYEKIQIGNFQGLNLKKLQGTGDEYRVRIGRIRIKFLMNANGIHIYDIDFRSDTTYSD